MAKAKSKSGGAAMEEDPSLRLAPSMSSLGSPGSVYDQYFDAFGDEILPSPLMDPSQAIKLANRGMRQSNLSMRSNLSKVTSLLGLQNSDGAHTPLPITSFDSTAPERMESEYYDEDGAEFKSRQNSRRSNNGSEISRPSSKQYSKPRVQSPIREESECSQKTEVSEAEHQRIVSEAGKKAHRTKGKDKTPVLSPTKSISESEDPPTPTLAITNDIIVEPERDVPEEPRIEVKKERKSGPDQVKKIESEKGLVEDTNDEPDEEEEEEDEGDDEEGIYDYYDILSVEKTEDPLTIATQYRKEIVLASFDRFSDDGKARIYEITEAYHVLTNPQRRQKYDETLEKEDISLMPLWKPETKLDPDEVFAAVFVQEIQKELFKPEWYFTPMSYIAGAIIGFILFSWPGIFVFAYLCGKVGHWEDHRCPTPKELIDKLSDNQRNALLHALSRYMPKDE